jgi:hypothetical protein
VAQTENLPYADQIIDLDPNVRDAWGCRRRVTYDWRRPNERAASSSCRRRWRDRAHDGCATGLARVGEPAGAGRHHEAARAWATPKTSVVNNMARAGRAELFVIGSSTSRR